MKVQNSLHWGDYLVFVSSIVLSMAIGIYYAVREGQKTTQEYLMANRKIQILPASLSLMVSYLSATTLLGDSSENYFYGITYSLYMVASVIGVFVAALVFVPLFYPLQLTSIQEYVYLRYESRAAVLAGYLYNVIVMMLVNGILLFGPAVMMEAVSGFPVWSSIVLVGVISTVYSSIGGFKGVIWTDVFQAVVILGALLAVSIQGTIAAGGIKKVFHEFNKGGRFYVIPEMSPFNRLDLGTMCVIHVIHRVGMFGMVQTSVQRFSSLSSMKKARMSVLMVIPSLLIVAMLSAFTGIVAYSYYAGKGCDPYRAGLIRNQNQILPFFVMDVLDVPGIPGLFVAGVFCGSLSSLSSSFSSVSAITWEDILKHRPYFKKLSERKRTLVTKVIVLIFGFLSIGVGLMVMNLKGSLIQMAYTVIGPLACSMFLLTALGPIFPHINGKSAIAGSLAGFVFSLWITVGALNLGHQFEPLPTITTNCTSPVTGNHSIPGSPPSVIYGMSNHSQHGFTTELQADTTNSTYPHDSHPQELHGIDHLYAISHMWYIVFGMVGGILTALVISIFPGFHETKEVDPRYLFPFIRPLLNCCSGPSDYHRASTEEEKDVKSKETYH